MCRVAPRLAPATLILASAIFCWLAAPGALALLAGSVIGNFVLARLLVAAPAQRDRQRLLIGAVALNLLPLALAKAGAFTLPGSAMAVGGTIPLGLAFYTLQQITFLVDVARTGAQPLAFDRYASWATLFCQLPAGPISAFDRMKAQFAGLGAAIPAGLDIARGFTLVLAGLVKKTWIADPLGGHVQRASAALEAAPTALDAWIVTAGFILQLYFDFSAYSDIAIGAALCFGIVLPANFNSPLKARSAGDYVMRWHISLMHFARDYVFQPVFSLGRKLPVRPATRRNAIAWAVATFCVFLVVGAWHTFSPAALAAAAIIGVLLIAFQLVRVRRAAKPALRGIVAIAVRIGHRAALLLLIALTALLLVMPSLEAFGRVLAAMADVPALAGQLAALLDRTCGCLAIVPPILVPASGGTALASVLVAGVIALTAPNTMQMFGVLAAPRATRLSWQPSLGWGLITGLLAVMAVSGITAPSRPLDFVYARF